MVRRVFAKIVNKRLQQGSWSPEDRFSTNWIKTTLEAHAANYKDLSRFRTGEPVHVSSLFDFCPRRQFLFCESPMLGHKQVRVSDLVVWKIGRGIESLIRESLLKHWDYKDIYGEWSCTCGQARRKGLYPGHKVRCDSCSSCLNIYNELRLIDEDCGVIGSPDILIRYKGKLVVIEIKSINDKGFMARKEAGIPLANHLLQPYMYHRLLRKNSLTPNPTMIIIYCKKEYQYNSPILEFHVPALDSKFGKVADEMLDRAKIVKDAFSTNKLPKRECDSETCYAAKKCAVRDLCFQYKE